MMVLQSNQRNKSATELDNFKQERSVMAFVNEYIPEADIKKFDINEINKQYIVGGTNARDWTVDRDRNMYLRCVARGREEFRHQSTWTFYWHGELLKVDIDTLEAGGKRGGASWSHKKIIFSEKKEVPLAYQEDF